MSKKTAKNTSAKKTSTKTSTKKVAEKKVVAEKKPVVLTAPQIEILNDLAKISGKLNKMKHEKTDAFSTMLITKQASLEKKFLWINNSAGRIEAAKEKQAAKKIKLAAKKEKLEKQLAEIDKELK